MAVAGPRDSGGGGGDFPQPKQHLIDYGKKYPGAWKLVDEMRSGKGREVPDWPEWCFVPVAGGISIATAFAEKILREQECLEMKRTPDDGAHDGGEPGGEPNSELELDDEQERRAALLQEILLDGPVIAALASWRPTQGIYRFDEDLLDAVWQTPLASPSTSSSTSASKLPTELLYHLPEWCCYIEAPGRSVWDSMEIAGFFAHLEWDTDKERAELRLVLDPAGPGERMIPVPIQPWSRYFGGSPARGRLGGEQPTPKRKEQMERRKFTGRRKRWGRWQRTSPPCFPPFFTCVRSTPKYGMPAPLDPQGGRLPANPEPKKTRKGMRLFPPDQPTVWETGYRMGAALRSATSAIEDSSSTGAEPTGRTMRPHYRRAHWHSFWRGPRSKPEEREITVKWIPPIPVNLGDIDEELVPVIRRVPGRTSDGA